MRIAQIVASLEARYGGPSRSVLGLSAGLARNGDPTDLLCTDPGDPALLRDDQPRLTTRTFGREWPCIFSPSAHLRRHLRDTPYDIVHHHGLWLRPLAYARSAAARFSAPLVISPRGMMSPWAWNHRRFKKTLAEHFIHPRAFQSAAGWHATSGEEAADIRRLGFKQPVCIAPNGVTPPLPAEEQAALAHWQAACPALAGRRVALFYSRFHPKKRVLELIDLWLSAPRGDWLLLLVGIPEEYTVPQLETHVLQQGGAGRILVRDGTDAPAPYAVSSLFLLPSHSENFGLVVAEALVRGVPVLTTDATPWLALDPTGAGRCVPWTAYGPALDGLLAESPAALAGRGRLGRDWARSEFSWTKTARLLAAFYASLRSPSAP